MACPSRRIVRDFNPSHGKSPFPESGLDRGTPGISIHHAGVAGAACWGGRTSGIADTRSGMVPPSILLATTMHGISGLDFRSSAYQVLRFLYVTFLWTSNTCHKHKEIFRHTHVPVCHCHSHSWETVPVLIWFRKPQNHGIQEAALGWSDLHVADVVQSWASS